MKLGFLAFVFFGFSLISSDVSAMLGCCMTVCENAAVRQEVLVIGQTIVAPALALQIQALLGALETQFSGVFQKLASAAHTVEGWATSLEAIDAQSNGALQALGTQLLNNSGVLKTPAAQAAIQAYTVAKTVGANPVFTTISHDVAVSMGKVTAVPAAAVSATAPHA